MEETNSTTLETLRLRPEDIEEEDNPIPKRSPNCLKCKFNPKRTPTSDYCQSCWDKRKVEREHSLRNGVRQRNLTPEAKIAAAREKMFANGELCLKCKQGTPNKGKTMCFKCELATEKANEANTVDEPTTVQDGLKYPQLRFPHETLPEGRLKDLTDKACEGGLSAGLVVPAILALASALPLQDKVEGGRINLYVTLLTMVGAGKDTAIDRAQEVLGLLESRHVTKYTPSGERSIAQLIGDLPGTKDDPVRRPGPRTHCFVTYELEETLRKNKGDTSGLFTALQHYFDHNDKTYTDTKNRHNQSVNCRLSWLTALPVGEGEIDETIYRSHFGESSTHGLTSRMIFGFAEERFDRRKTRNWHVPQEDYTFGEVTEEMLEGIGPITKDTRTTLEQELRDAKCKGFAAGVEKLYLDWQPKKDWSGRDAYHALKVAAVTAIINGHEYIEESDWRFAVVFMGWQGQIRQTFAPGRAKKTTQGEFNELVIKEMQKRTAKALGRGDYKDKSTEVMTVDGKKRVYIRWKGMANDGDWYKHGLDIEKTIKALVNGGYLDFKREVNFADGGKAVSEEVNDLWVRIIGWKPEK